jgi:hypothetical protein
MSQSAGPGRSRVAAALSRTADAEGTLYRQGERVGSGNRRRNREKTHKGQLATRMETTYATLATGYGEDRHGARGACTAGPDVGCPAGKAQ